MKESITSRLFDFMIDCYLVVGMLVGVLFALATVFGGIAFLLALTLR